VFKALNYERRIHFNCLTMVTRK